MILGLMRITRLEVRDIRFPTSKGLDGSDAMNPDPDYSSAYVILHTDTEWKGYGSTFTIGRGNDVVCAAVMAHEHLVVGLTLEEFRAAPGAVWRRLTGDSQLRWIGPDKGVIHLACGDRQRPVGLVRPPCRNAGVETGERVHARRVRGLRGFSVPHRRPDAD